MTDSKFKTIEKTAKIFITLVLAVSISKIIYLMFTTDYLNHI